MKKLDNKLFFLTSSISYHKSQMNLQVGNQVESIRKSISTAVSCLSTIILFRCIFQPLLQSASIFLKLLFQTTPLGNLTCYVVKNCAL